MSRTASVGVLKIRYVPTIANKAAPTVAEINAGVDLSSQLTRDGLATPSKGSTIDASDISDAFNSTAAGPYGGDPITAKFHRDAVTGSDTAWSTLPRLTAGYFVVGRFGLTPSAGQRVEVWPITVISREMADTAENETEKFTVTCAVPTPPNDNAVVA